MSGPLRVERRIKLAGPTNGEFDQFREDVMFTNDGGTVPVILNFDSSKLVGTAHIRKAGPEVAVEAHMLFPLPDGFGFSLGGVVVQQSQLVDGELIAGLVEILCVGCIPEHTIPGPVRK